MFAAVVILIDLFMVFAIIEKVLQRKSEALAQIQFGSY